MARDDLPSGSEECTCLAVRQAARHVTQFYDRNLARSGLRITQFSILAKLRRAGPTTINELAALMVMDRTTLGRNVVPLQRGGLVKIVADPGDRRRRKLVLTAAGTARLQGASQAWRRAQARFASAFGAERAADLRALMHAVAATDLPDGVGARG